MPQNLYRLLSAIFSNNQIRWIAPYHELRHLHYTNWRLYFSSWSPKGDLRIFLISSPTLGNFFLYYDATKLCHTSYLHELIGKWFLNRWSSGCSETKQERTKKTEEKGNYGDIFKFNVCMYWLIQLVLSFMTIELVAS